jgi:hypothetical protein
LSTALTVTPEPRTAVLWAVVRWSAFGAVPILLIWLLVQPSSALNVLWYAVVPVLPATFFLNPTLWRGVCPLATLSELGNRLGKQRPLPPRVGRGLNVVGLALFYLMVPARHFVFNQNGLVLAITVVAVGGLALGLGAVFAVRSASCNALCPILPIELLYGMAPLVPMERSRCTTCTVCTPRGCFDLAKHKTIAQRLGPTRRTARWITTPYGIFFTSLPGFIIGYNQVTDGSLSTAAVVYATTLGWSFASILVIGVVVLALRPPSGIALPLIAAAAGGVYYWYAGPATTTQLAAPAWLASGIRIVGLGLVAFWLARALASSGSGAAATNAKSSQYYQY